MRFALNLGFRLPMPVAKSAQLLDVYFCFKFHALASLSDYEMQYFTSTATS